MTSSLDKFFHLTDRQSDVRTEVLGGLTTFVTMAYIIVVNPAILKFAGLPVEPSTIATILTAAFGTALMGLYANLPIAIAPYMGENAFIAFGMASLGVGWQLRLGAVFVSGLAFLALSLLRIRPWLANAISPSLKHSFAVGIGLFLAFIGMYESGIVTSGASGLPAASLTIQATQLLQAPAVPVKLGNFHDTQVLLALLGFLIMAVLHYRRVKGAILIGIAAGGALGIALGLAAPPASLIAMPFQGRYSLAPIALQLDIAGVFRLSFLPVLLTLFLMSFLDTLGTLVGVGAAGKMLDDKGNFPDIERPMLVDSVSCVLSSLLGTSTSGAFIESATGIKDGARSGLSSIVVALLFLAALFFLPLIEPLQQLRCAYTPALIFVGLLMMQSITKVDFDDLCELVPAFVCIVMMLFSYNIANGLTAGLILYPLLKALVGRHAELPAGSVVLALLCLVYYLFGLPH